MHHFMYDGAYVITTISNGDLLIGALSISLSHP